MPNDTNQAIFDPKEFLAKVGEGKTILEFRKDQIVFAKAMRQIPSSIFKKVGSRLLSYPSKARKPWSAFWSPASSLAKAA
jgi:hypothetical protein